MVPAAAEVTAVLFLVVVTMVVVMEAGKAMVR